MIQIGNMALENLFGPKFDQLHQGLGLASQRQGLLMRNLANANVPGYKRQDMDFHVQLQDRLGLKGPHPRGGEVRFDGSNARSSRSPRPSLVTTH